MAYRVAMDAVPEGKEPGEGAMAKSWMEAAGQDGIPTAFIINKEGKIAWIGHPMSDGEAAREGHRRHMGHQDGRRRNPQGEEKARPRCRNCVQAPIGAAIAGPEKILEAIDEIIAQKPEMELRFGPMKLQPLLKLDQQDKALEFAKKLAKSEIGEQAEGLNFIAWAIVDPEVGSSRRPSSQVRPRPGQEGRRQDGSQERCDRRYPGQGILRLGRRRQGHRDPGASRPLDEGERRAR